MKRRTPQYRLIGLVTDKIEKKKHLWIVLAQAIRIRTLALTIYIILSSLRGIWQLLVQTQNAHKDDSILDKKTYSERNNNINTVLRLIVLHVFSTNIQAHTRIKKDIRTRKHSPTYTCIDAQWTDSNCIYFCNFSESFLFKRITKKEQREVEMKWNEKCHR